MKRKEFERLKKAMELANSENDHEALAAIRLANKILREAGDLTWTRVLDRSVQIQADYDADPQASAPSPADVSGRTRTVWAGKSDAALQKEEDEALIERAVCRFPNNDFVRDIAESMELRTFITGRQRKALQSKLGEEE